MNNKTESMLAEHLFSQHEENFSHGSFDREIAFYESICTGDIEMVQMLASPLCSEGYGVLSNDPLRNIQYHLAISAAMIARFCVKSGMTPEEAYQLSDLYIMQADECKTVEEVHAVHAEMLKIYTRKMRYVHSGKAYSKQVINAIDYISEHLHGRIMLEARHSRHLQTGRRSSMRQICCGTPSTRIWRSAICSASAHRAISSRSSRRSCT